MNKVEQLYPLLGRWVWQQNFWEILPLSDAVFAERLAASDNKKSDYNGRPVPLSIGTGQPLNSKNKKHRYILRWGKIEKSKITAVDSFMPIDGVCYTISNHITMDWPEALRRASAKKRAGYTLEQPYTGRKPEQETILDWFNS